MGAGGMGVGKAWEELETMISLILCNNEGAQIAG
jgi:hypothetical protein